MKTILHVIDSNEPGGAETVFVQLADGLRDRGYRSVTVVSGSGWPREELLRRGLAPISIDAKGTFNLSLLRALLRIIERERVALIQSHLLGSNVYCALAGLLSRTPVVATFHGMVDVSPTERLRKLKFLIMDRGVSRFVAVSQRLRDAIHKEGLLDPAKTSVIYNGVDPRRYQPSQRKREWRERLGIPQDAFLVGSLGNLHPAKGYGDLIRAARHVIDLYPDTHFVVGGDLKTGIYAELRDQLRAEGMESRVHFVGFVTDTAAFLSELDLFLLTSLSEGFSIAILEALATGLPVVSTRCGGPQEILTDRSNGLLVEVGNPRAIAAGIDELRRDAQLRARLAGEGPNFVARTFGIDVMLDKYEGLYRTLWSGAGNLS